MAKFQRNYKFLIQTIGGEMVEVKLPFTIEFDIVRNILAKGNTANFRIYNLSEFTRNSIYKDVNNFRAYRSVQLKAGYGDDTPTVFKGNVSWCRSVREGTNFISSAECYDAGFAFVNSKVASSYPKGTAQSSIFEDMIKTMHPSVTVGAVGNFNTAIPRGNTYSGNTQGLLDEISGGAFFVDLEKAYVLKDNECLRGALPAINSESGLLGTPVREETIINFDMIFEPRLLIGQKITLDSSTAPAYNGDYKIVSVKHRGTISDAVCGDAVTSVGLWHGPAFTVIN